jgi:hypothetical protein
MIIMRRIGILPGLAQYLYEGKLGRLGKFC